MEHAPKINYLLHKTKPADHTLVFLHIPKCAGTTMHRLIENQYGHMYDPDNLLLSWPGKPGKTYHSVEDNADNVLVLKGHFILGQEEKFLTPGSPRTYTTILRHPVDRVLSDYWHHVKRYKTFGDITLTEFLEGEYLVNSNLMTYMLSGGWQDNLRQAIENLRKFDLVGVVEHFDVYIDRLDDHVGWPAHAPVPRQNEQTKRLRIGDLTTEEYQLLVMRNLHDITLYLEARKLALTFP